MQDEIRILIIEDEELWLKSLQANLFDFGFEITGTARNFESAVKALNQKNYDIVLLDIHINGQESGIELGQMLQTFYHKPFIFITASFDQHTVQQAVKVRPSAYLTKPVHPATLFVTIQTALLNYTNQVAASSPHQATNYDSFFVKQGDRYKKIYWKDVVSLSSEKNYTGILSSTDGTTSFIRSTLPKTLRYLVPSQLQSNFVQVNRSQAVQLSFISEFTKNEIKTAFTNFPVTEGYIKEVKEKLHIIG